jgi:Xaa-Pro aminopeptidase
MSGPSSRINTPISTTELQRRWAATRAAMAAAGIDVLVVQNNNDHMGGYVKWFTDMPATNGYPLTVAFPREEEMSVVGMGAIGADRILTDENRGPWRGVKRHMGTPSFASVHYTSTAHADLLADAIEPWGTGTIGLVGAETLSWSLVAALQRRFGNASFVDASDLVDQIKVIKSDEEIALIRRTADLQERAMIAAFQAIRPGMRDIEVSAVAEQVGHKLGSEQGIFLCASSTIGTPVMKSNRHGQMREIQDGDLFTLLVENNGPGGYYAEYGRSCIFGRASQQMQEEFAEAVEAQDFAASLLVPGASCPEVWERYNQFMRARGWPPERRLYCHGQGYDLVERPLVRFDEPMRIAARMNMAIHPNRVSERTHAWLCDNFLVMENGTTRLHQSPRVITEIT